MKNAILVYEDAGQVKHCFCSAEEARARLEASTVMNSGGSVFTNESIDAAMLYAVSPQLRDRVNDAKLKLRSDIAVREALNRHGVPQDTDLRTKIANAIKDLRTTVLQPAVV